MTATDELRKTLDELGVKWEAPTSFDGTARYDTVAGGYWFHEFNGKITVHGLTPKQAIAATLGDTNLAAENAKLRELSVRMARALGVKSGWCTTDCAREFGCAGMDRCPIEVALVELDIDIYKRAKSEVPNEEA